jgi:MFS family permease
MQGIGIGGEWGGAVLMAVEHSPKGKRGFYGSWPQIGVPAGLMLSAGVVALLSFLSDEQFLAWGWRVAFLLSGLLVAVGLYIRVKIIETPDFQKVKESRSESNVPFVDLLREHPRNVLLGMGARYIEGVCFNIFGVFIITYVTTTLQLPRSTALLGVIIASAIMIVMVPIYGMLSDRIGRRTIYCCGAAAIGILIFPSFWLMNTYREAAWVWFAIVLPFSFAYPAVYGPQAALFSELFNPRVRYTGISFVYQFSGIFASGLTPLIATALLGYGNGQPWLICAYVAVVAAISFLSVAAMRFHHGDPATEASSAPSGRLGTVMPK